MSNTEFFRAANLTQSQRSNISSVDVNVNYADTASVNRSSIYGNGAAPLTLFRRETAIHNMEASQNYGISFGSGK